MTIFTGTGSRVAAKRSQRTVNDSVDDNDETEEREIIVGS